MGTEQLPSYSELPLAPGGRGRSAWHLFGREDNVGLVNLQTPERVAAAAREIRHGRMFNLNAPTDYYRPPLYARSAARHRLIPEPGDNGFDDEIDAFNPQAGSQWDSLAHVPAAPGRFYNGVTVPQVRQSHRNTIGHWVAHGIAGRGVLLDAERITGASPGEAAGFTVADLERCRRSAGTEIEPGDILVLHTGFGRWYSGQPESARAAMADERVLTAAGVEHSEAMAEYLWDLHISAIVSDGPSVEMWPPDWRKEAQPFGFLHHTLIGLFGLALGELWWLADLADDCRGDGRYTMFVASAPLNVPGGVSSPAERGGLQVTQVLRRIADLPDFFALVEDDWHLDLLDTGLRLMRARVPGLLRVSPELVVAFRYRDIRDLAVARDVGNMPIDVLTGQSARREPGRARPAEDDPAGERRGFFLMLADQAFTHNPPLHQLTRRMLSRQILRRNMRRLEPLAAEISSSLLDGIRGRSEVDFAAEVARPFAARFWGGVLGLTAGESAEVAALMRDLDRIFQLQRSPGDSRVVDRAAGRYVDIVTCCVDRELAAGRNSFIQEMAADLAVIDVEGKPESLGSYVAANLFDGFHTVGVAVSNALYALLAADRYEDMLREPGLVPAAFGEALRIAPPLLLTHRYTLADVVHDGLLLPAGTAIAMLWGSPGFDPSVFEDPWRLRWDREPRLLFAFGGGPHLCPGRTAAHVLVEHALRTFVARGINWQLVDGHSYRWQPASAMRELVDFPVRVTWPRG